MLPIIAAIPAILASITKVAATIGPFLAKNAPLLLDLAGKYLPKIIQTVEAISSILNITSPSESAEELGAKAMIADKKPEDFDKHNDYIDYLRKEVSIDKTELSDEKVDLLTRQAIGTSLMIKGVSETLGTEVTIPFIKTVSQLGLDAKVIIEVVKAYSNSDLTIDDIEKYTSKTLPIDQLDKHGDTLVDAYQKADSSMSVEQAEDAVMDLEIPKDSL